MVDVFFEMLLFVYLQNILHYFIEESPTLSQCPQWLQNLTLSYPLYWELSLLPKFNIYSYVFQLRSLCFHSTSDTSDSVNTLELIIFEMVLIDLL